MSEIDKLTLVQLDVLAILQEKYPKASYEYPGYINIPFYIQEGETEPDGSFAIGTAGEVWSVDCCNADGTVFGGMNTEVQSTCENPRFIAEAIFKTLDEVIAL